MFIATSVYAATLLILQLLCLSHDYFLITAGWLLDSTSELHLIHFHFLFLSYTEKYNILIILIALEISHPQKYSLHPFLQLIFIPFYFCWRILCYPTSYCFVWCAHFWVDTTQPVLLFIRKLEAQCTEFLQWAPPRSSGCLVAPTALQPHTLHTGHSGRLVRHPV